MRASAKQREIKKFTLEKGDVVITKDSESPGDIAIPALIREELQGVLCGYHLAIIRPDPELADGGFLNSLFALARVRHGFFALANGATRFGLSIGSIENAKFTIPDIKEQRRIAEIIMVQDDEIINLTSQLAHLVQQKRALMQQLLTGKRRVKLDNARTTKGTA
jgi:type I restriction enzyme S subunit